jgi:ComF family protein
VVSPDCKPYFPTPRDLPPRSLHRATDAILSLFFPDRCLACSRPVARLCEAGLCPDCWQRLLSLEIAAAGCVLCGLPLPGLEAGGTQLCIACASDTPSFAAARSFGYYRGELGLCLRAIKFQGRRNLIPHIGPLMARTAALNFDRTSLDEIVPVPLHPARRRERGFNQAELLAREVGRLLSVPVRARTLARVRPTAPQVGLSHAERRANVRGAFSCLEPGASEGMRILLIDDILTTGATAESAASALRAGGASRVYVLSAARAVPGME